MTQESVHQVFLFLKSDAFGLIVSPIVITIVTSVVKTCSKDVHSSAFERQDIAVGFDLYLAAIVSLLTFIVLLASHYVAVDAKAPPTDIAAVDQANQQLFEMAAVAAAIAVGFALLLVPVLFLYSRFGWERLWLGSGDVVYQPSWPSIVATLILGGAAFTTAGMFIGAN